MRLTVLALLLSAGPIAVGQPNPSASQAPNPASCDPALNLASPDACLQSVSPAISSQPAPHLNPNWANRGLPQVKPAIPAELLSRVPNPLQFLALNQAAPRAVPKTSPRGKSEPIPTIFPDAHFERIPTNWPGLEFLLINQSPPANASTDSKMKMTNPTSAP
jgi:hypothetical protein